MQKFKIITIIGARPQFIKASAISRAIREKYADLIREVIVHTGQHYDDNMSRVFFDELEIPAPDYNLEVGSGSHAYQTAEIMRKAEKILLEEKPQLMIVYGDTNTTLAGALTAAKLHIPVAHIEAGLRSFNKSMPEEINRIVCDHLSTFLFAPTKTGFNNLAKEGFDPYTIPPFNIDKPGIYHCGDVMFDNTLYFREKAVKKSHILENLGLEGKEFILCTIHRENNTDNVTRLVSILKTLDEISRERKMFFVLPLHPRTSKMISLLPDKDIPVMLATNPFLKITDPVSYFDMLMLESRCRMTLTDSGGVQKESYFFRKPCLVLRPESEWKELIELETASIVDADQDLTRKAFDHYYDHPPKNYPPIFGNGKAAEFILHELVNFLNTDLQG